ncbi:MAG: tRNA (N(6)-L-threonylcarbamoyladenosine(37)-C(2))-methylthiotransferase MtaB [Prevotellaceae bacterium]|nr:tRNA (N(6)-L-threonylcarbamoyladenosine(37)-C(2))-methylthiotransferase MtaB [Prevotellaceae bacterium]MDO4931713.1 tRNA (N(6)-L-threonylcarbamoyladenosine(37)-C(2))-methylthiotransferase MtaB [Prevotellaceae bacterium]
MSDTAIFQGKTATYHTLGCKLNFSETSTFCNLLENLGVRTVGKDENADLCIVNTCSVTDVADRKCRQIIRRMKHDNPNAFMVITGCYAQLEPKKLKEIEGVDLILGNNEKANLVEYIRKAWKEKLDGDHSVTAHTVATKDIRDFQPSCSRGNRTRYWLKVQDGCNYYCTYCTIPFARGNSRNPSIESLVRQAEKAARDGGKEIVLTGVNIGDFGRTTNESFLDLVKALDNIEGIERYRISSLEPDLISNELIDFCAKSRAFMPHFHIPLQSGSDTVLKLMHRRYDAALFTEKILKIKELMPQAFIGVDVMVGTRGETQEYFEETYNLLESLPVTQLHVFPYSERPGTAALKIPHVVTSADKELRSKRLIALSDAKTKTFYEEHIGKRMPVLFEKAQQGKAMHGFTDNYIRVELSTDVASADYDNKIVPVLLQDFNQNMTALTATI